MARERRNDGGGIAGLRQLIADHGEAIAYDLITIGLRLEWLGTEALTWRDLLTVVRQSPPDSALRRALDTRTPEERVWDVHAQLLAGIFDVLSIISWHDTEDGQNGVNAPQPIPRPGITPDAKSYGTGSMTPEQAEAWLARKNPLQHRG